MNTKSPNWLRGNRYVPNEKDFSDVIAWADHKISFVTSYCQGKKVLDLGSVQHNPENYKSKYWLHKALVGVADQLEGMDLSNEGVSYLNKMGYKVVFGDAENFDLGKKYDVIVAGDLIEHLENLRGFFNSCRSHLRPGGKLLISTPNPWYWRNVAKGSLRGHVSTNPEHTLWMCPYVLGQLSARHDMRIEYCCHGSRYLKDRIMPLPPGIKHTSFHAVLTSTS